jgi:FlaA1/EpsC-like NDP-sugar epimerase
LTRIGLILNLFEEVTGRKEQELFFSDNQIQFFKQNRILITGASGSIGSVIAKKLHNMGVENLFISDRDESTLHRLSLEFNYSRVSKLNNFLLMDIKSTKSVRDAFQTYKPTVVIHTAALKHVSALEKQPEEALETNVFGSANILECSMEHGIDFFVNISTDKAVNPTTVLGRSKKLAELYTNVQKIRSGKQYVSCRFGNVFNSRGSVIETFLHQIHNNEPLTLSSKNAKRYFMSIPQAASLSLISIFEKNADVVILKMGQEISILSIVNKMREIFQSNSPIAITELLDAEKETEELISENELNQSIDSQNYILTQIDRSDPRLNKLMKKIEDREDQDLLKYLING